MIDRARPGLVALYDIRPGNGAGQFLQPRSPHGACSPGINREGERRALSEAEWLTKVHLEKCPLKRNV